MVKQETINKKIKRIEDSLDRMERGLYSGVKIGWITDQICWLWKFRYIDEAKLNDLCSHATYVINQCKPD